MSPTTLRAPESVAGCARHARGSRLRCGYEGRDRQQHIAEHGAPVEQDIALKNNGDVVHGALDCTITHADGAGGRRDEPGNQHQQGALSASARPHDGDEFAGLDGEIDFAQRLDLAPARRPVALCHRMQGDGDAGALMGAAAVAPHPVVRHATRWPGSRPCSTAGQAA